MEESHCQYGGGCAVRWKLCSTDLSHHQYGCVTSSVRWRVCITDLSCHQYGSGCAVRISHSISTDEDVQYYRLTN